MAPHSKCLICGSRKWRKNVIGLVTCDEGHVLEHYINESEEADNVGTHIMKKRTLKSNRQKKASRADPKVYRGDRARFHYYQCLQLLFREQVAALTELWSLPPQFETICRDLWALHLNLIPSPPPAEPLLYARDQEGYQCVPRDTRQMNRGQSARENAGHTETSDSTEPPSSQEEMLIPEIAVLSEEESFISSSDDSFSDDGPRARNTSQIPSKSAFVSRADRPENTIAILVLACWVIRLPVIYVDFIDAVESYTLPYLDRVRTFPLSLTRHLAIHAVQALSPHYAPKTLTLHRLTSRLASRIYDNFDIVLPELNAAPVLWRVVRDCFGGTPMLYVLTKRVGSVLSLQLSLQGSTLTSKRSDPDKQRYDNAPAEVSLVATAIVVLKLVYGLDGKERLPRSSDDAGCALPAVAEFLAAAKGADHAGGHDSSRLFGSRVPMCVGDLNDAALDEYLHFCQRVLVDPKRDEHRTIDDYFPLGSGAADTNRGEPRCPGGKGLSSTRKNDGKLDVPEPGEMYKIYDAQDVLGNLPEDLDAIVERAARWTGVKADFVCGVLERYERRLERWDEKRHNG